MLAMLAPVINTFLPSNAMVCVTASQDPRCRRSIVTSSTEIVPVMLIRCQIGMDQPKSEALKRSMTVVILHDLVEASVAETRRPSLAASS